MLAVGDVVRWSTWPEDMNFVILELLPGNAMRGSILAKDYTKTSVLQYATHLIYPNANDGYWIKIGPAKSNLLQRKGIKYVSN
jgi:hypothetical protein